MNHWLRISLSMYSDLFLTALSLLLASGVMRMLRGTVLSPLGRPPPWLPPRGSLVGLVFVMLVGGCSPVTWRKRGFWC